MGKNMELQEQLDRLAMTVGNLESNYKFMARKAKENREKLDMLASACSDLILGGERGWYDMDFDEFVALVRKELHAKKRDNWNPVKVKERPTFPAEY